ncbi:hypothetical protein SOQ14_06205 [Erythrobacter sp. T5W1-R]|uniref:hypothetical protein n=1 Tax=Erythrobacter sp. T5W1-R TaxID=3101752 RepID=UPI002AFE9BB1|nr:hypothetical protein [Erythrobacter sp. T5W1-R]MEA1618503.1 hypothetical protein [Erythrobacter sp. T5W1-R]
MILLMIAQATRVLGGDPAEGTDHTQQVAIVAEFLAGEQSAVSPSVMILNRDNPNLVTMADLRSYASECPIKEITAVPSASKPLPIAVSWSCLRFIEVDGQAKWEERSAGFWVEGGTITKITFGTPPTIELEDVRKGAAKRLRERAQEGQ